MTTRFLVMAILRIRRRHTFTCSTEGTTVAAYVPYHHHVGAEHTPTFDRCVTDTCMSLKTWRERRGFTQTQLSELSDVNRVMINNYERGRKSPRKMTLETAYRLADALDVEPRVFLEPDAAQPGETL